MGLKGGLKNKDQSRQMSRVSLREQTHLYYFLFVNQMSITVARCVIVSSCKGTGSG